MEDEIRATPRNYFVGLLSDAMNSGVGYMKDTRRTQQLQGLGRLIESTGIPYTVENISYDPSGRGLFTGAGGLGGTTRMRPEALEAAMTVAPFVGPAARVASREMMAAGRAGEQLAERVVPQIMERGGLGADILQDMATNTASNITQFKGFKNTTAFGKAKEVAKYLDSLDIPYTLNKSKTTNSAYLEVQTGKGDFDYPMQFRFSDHSTDLPHQNRQIFTNPKPDPNFDLDVFKDGGHDAEFAVNKINELVKKSAK